MFFEVFDELYLLLIKSKEMSESRKRVLFLKIIWNTILFFALASIPFLMFIYLTS